MSSYCLGTICKDKGFFVIKACNNILQASIDNKIGLNSKTLNIRIKSIDKEAYAPPIEVYLEGIKQGYFTLKLSRFDYVNILRAIDVIETFSQRELEDSIYSVTLPLSMSSKQLKIENCNQTQYVIAVKIKTALKWLKTKSEVSYAH